MRDPGIAKTAGEGAAASEGLLSSLLGSVNDLVWCMSTSEQRLLYVNPAAGHIYGRPDEELLAHPSLWRDAIHAEDRDEFERNLVDSCASTLVHNLLWFLHTKCAF